MELAQFKDGKIDFVDALSGTKLQDSLPVGQMAQKLSMAEEIFYTQLEPDGEARRGSRIQLHGPDFVRQGSSPYSCHVEGADMDTIKPYLTNFVEVSSFHLLLPYELMPLDSQNFSEKKLKKFFNIQARMVTMGVPSEYVHPSKSMINPDYVHDIHDHGAYRKIVMSAADEVFTVESAADLRQKLGQVPQMQQQTRPRP